MQCKCSAPPSPVPTFSIDIIPIPFVQCGLETSAIEVSHITTLLS
jgi:hypothetical protein